MKKFEHSLWLVKNQELKKRGIGWLGRELNKSISLGYRLVSTLVVGDETWFIFEIEIK